MSIFIVEIFRTYKNMNSSFVAISILIKSDIGEKSLINTQMNMLSE